MQGYFCSYFGGPPETLTNMADHVISHPQKVLVSAWKMDLKRVFRVGDAHIVYNSIKGGLEDFLYSGFIMRGHQSFCSFVFKIPNVAFVLQACGWQIV